MQLVVAVVETITLMALNRVEQMEVEQVDMAMLLEQQE
jgi:hypothetical protein